LTELKKLESVDDLFLPAELAYSAKTRGYDEPSLAWYDFSKSEVELCRPPKGELHRNSEWSSVSAPLYQQMFAWLLTKGFFLQTELITPDRKWLCEVYDTNGNFWGSPSNGEAFPTYRESWDKAIEYALKFLPEAQPNGVRKI